MFTTQYRPYSEETRFSGQIDENKGSLQELGQQLLSNQQPGGITPAKNLARPAGAINCCFRDTLVKYAL
jgi:hypothetical protein